MKYYFIDNGLLHIFLTDANTSLLENIVAIQLYKKYGNEVYFYNQNIEVDFIIPEQKTASLPKMKSVLLLMKRA